MRTGAAAVRELGKGGVLVGRIGFRAGLRGGSRGQVEEAGTAARVRMLRQEDARGKESVGVGWRWRKLGPWELSSALAMLSQAAVAGRSQCGVLERH